MGRMFQIHDDDLSDLEHMVPDLCSKLAADLHPRQKSQLRRIKDILSNVRWDYGPWGHVTRLSNGEQDEPEAPTST